MLLQKLKHYWKKDRRGRQLVAQPKQRNLPKKRPRQTKEPNYRLTCSLSSSSNSVCKKCRQCNPPSPTPNQEQKSKQKSKPRGWKRQDATGNTKIFQRSSGPQQPIKQAPKMSNFIARKNTSNIVLKMDGQKTGVL